MTPRITLTGIDERTDLDAVSRMAADGVEFAALLSENPQGRHRYPSTAWMAAAIQKLGRRCAVHVCGRAARERFLCGDYDGMLDLVGRIQINGKVERHELVWAMSRYPDQEIVTQHTEANDGLRFPGDIGEKHSLLVDGSGGRGILPAQWVRPETTKSVGFAGGLGPVNLPAELPKIAAIAFGDWWVDMESSLRDEGDWFDIRLAWLAILAVRVFREGEVSHP